MAITEAQQARANNRPPRKAQPKGRTKSGKGRKSAAPITAHPMFPAIVALWFAAAFGLGSLAIRPGLIEELVLKLGIDTIIPAAAPPLGVTARILLALGLGAFGAILGTMLARRLNRPKVEAKPRSRKAGRSEPGFAARSRDTHPDAPARRPIFAHEELGADDLSDTRPEPLRPSEQPLPGRRRALAIEDEAPRDFHERAPLPGDEPQILDIGAFAIDDENDAGAPEPVSLHAAELDLTAFAPPPPPAGFESVRLGPAQADGTAVPFSVSAPKSQEPDADNLPRIPEGAIVPQPRFDRPEGSVFDIPVQAPRLFSRPADNEEPLADIVISPPVEADANTTAEMPSAVQPQSEPVRFTLPQGPVAARLQTADLGALSHVELIERLALSLKHRRDNGDQAVAEAEQAASEPPAEAIALKLAAAPQTVAEVAADVPADPAPAALALPSLPAALRPVAFDEPFHDPAEGFAFHLPLRQLTMPAAVAEPEPAPEVVDEATAPEENLADDDESGYSSLLDLRLTPAPARGGVVRIEEPEPLGGNIEPVVIFPGHAAPQAAEAPTASLSEESAAVMRRFDAPGTPGVPSQTMAASPPPPDPEETERALRAALASLQRMSGAA